MCPIDTDAATNFNLCRKIKNFRTDGQMEGQGQI